MKIREKSEKSQNFSLRMGVEEDDGRSLGEKRFDLLNKRYEEEKPQYTEEEMWIMA